MRPGRVLLALLLVGVVVIGLPRAEDLVLQLRRALANGDYATGLARARAASAAGPVPAEARWLHARLEDDPARFEALAQQLETDPSAPRPLAARARYARSREEFAQGRYRSAWQGFSGIEGGAREAFGELPLFEAMAAQASGDVAAARRILRDIPAGHPSHAAAAALLAELALRAGRAGEALEHADRALQAGAAEVGPMALRSRALALEALGRQAEADAASAGLLRRFPNSAEAALVRGRERVVAAAPTASIREAEPPARRQDWALQLGAFRDRSLALRHAARLEARGLPGLRIEVAEDEQGAWYRVLAGSFASRGEADEARGRLRADGVEASLVGPGDDRR